MIYGQKCCICAEKEGGIFSDRDVRIHMGDGLLCLGELGGGGGGVQIGTASFARTQMGFHDAP